MTILLNVGFQTPNVGTFAARFTANAANYEIVMTSGSYCHTDITSFTGGTSYTLVTATILQTLLRTAEGDSDFTVTYDATTNKFTIAHAGSNFSTSQGTATAAQYALFKQVFGLSGDIAATTSKTSDNAAYYGILTDVDSTSNDSNVYEPDGVAEFSEMDDGSHYAVARYTAPRYRDFELQFQTKAKVFVDSLASTTPWTFEHMFRHARGHEPILVKDTTGGVSSTLHFLRDASFKAKRAVEHWDTYWHVPLMTRQR